MNQFYFKINLNKYGEQRLEQVRESRTFRNSAISFVVGMIILTGFWLSIQNGLARKVKNREQYLSETTAQLKDYQTSGDYLSSNDLNRLAKTFTDRIFWAKKMVALGAEIDDKLAVRSFSYANGILTINGITEVDKNVKEFDLINEFIQRLKSNPEINNDFPDIKSGPVVKQVVKDTAIFEFVIECYSTTYGGGRR
ncbi:MAG: PilN domain-containing protein [Candidatus Cloacimonetes bacterium]|nr:PilN domain-containing protein [Candidatus Cloacimonadota bacterium]